MGIQEGTITATGAKDPITIGGGFNLSLRNFGTATIVLQRSFDGSNWGDVETFSANAEKVGAGTEAAQYRLNCTAYTSGTISYRLSG